MKKLIIIVSLLYLTGCNTVTSFNDSIIINHTYQGSFRITGISDSTITYTEKGRIQITFYGSTYNYNAFYNDTTGIFYKNGLHDSGKYSEQSHAIFMQDRATTILVMNPFGLPSLYLDGLFKVSKESHQIILIKKSNFQECVITLDDYWNINLQN